MKVKILFFLTAFFCIVSLLAQGESETETSDSQNELWSVVQKEDKGEMPIDSCLLAHSYESSILLMAEIHICLSRPQSNESVPFVSSQGVYIELQILDDSGLPMEFFLSENYEQSNSLLVLGPFQLSFSAPCITIPNLFIDVTNSIPSVLSIEIVDDGLVLDSLQIDICIRFEQTFLNELSSVKNAFMELDDLNANSFFEILNDKLIIKTDENSNPSSCEIYDLLGRKLLVAKLSEELTEIDLSMMTGDVHQILVLTIIDNKGRPSSTLIHR